MQYLFFIIKELLSITFLHISFLIARTLTCLRFPFLVPSKNRATTGAIRIERKAITQPSTCTHTWGHIRAVVGQGFVLHHGANEGRLRERET